MQRVETDATKVHAVLDALEAAGCPCWISGGWGIDALAGRQTRAHRDLDLAIDASREAEALRALAALGYTVETDWRPVRVEVAEPGGGRVDLHPVVFGEDGDGRQAGPGDDWFDYPRADLTTGTIAGRRVPCISARLQREFHQGYAPRPVDVADLRVLGEGRARLHVGCAMWTHKAWPKGPGTPLQAYAGRCNAVEGNTTFYATPARDTVAAWAQQTAPDFRFVVKLPKRVTHERRLADAGGDVRAFLDAIEPLGPRTHAVWIQLPASLGPGDTPVLEGFLRRLPVSLRYAVEVRHPDFFTDPGAAGRLEAALAPAAAEWVPFDTTAFFSTPPTSDAERDAWTKKPRVPLRTAALTERPIVRYLGRDDPERTVEGWRHWVDVVTGWLAEGRTPTVFVHTPDNADAPALARRFHDAVRAACRTSRRCRSHCLIQSRRHSPCSELRSSALEGAGSRGYGR